MVQSLLAWLAGLIIATISSLGYLGIAGLMAVESACIPLPSEIIMPFSGYLVSTGRFDLPLVATAGAIGCNIGSTLAYAAGYFGARRLLETRGARLLVNPRELAAVDRFFQRYGSITVLVGRLLPVVRTFVALPAGIARMPQLRFQVYTFVGSWPWCYALAYVGMRLGERWNSDPTLRTWLHRFDAVIVLLLVLGLAWFVWHRWRQAAEPDA